MTKTPLPQDYHLFVSPDLIRATNHVNQVNQQLTQIREFVQNGWNEINQEPFPSLTIKQALQQKHSQQSYRHIMSAYRQRHRN